MIIVHNSGPRPVTVNGIALPADSSLSMSDPGRPDARFTLTTTCGHETELDELRHTIDEMSAAVAAIAPVFGMTVREHL